MTKGKPMSNRLAPIRNRRNSLMLALALVLAACGGSHKPAAAKKSPSPSPSAHAASSAAPAPPPPPPATCPLNGENVASVPARPALAIKVDNSPQARPQWGLDTADMVYEEPVEGGVTRFVVIFQCQDASRVEPVRSARQADPYIVNQAGKSLLANAGESPPTLAALNSAVSAGWIVNVGYNTGGGYQRDPGRGSPYNLETSTHALYSRPDAQGVPTAKPIFTYSANPAPGGPGSTIHIGFSQYSDVYWHWNAQANAYQRYYGNSPALGANGGIISAQDIVIQAVPVQMSWWIEDPSGSHQPVPQLMGTGAALVCRRGSCVTGTWSRPGEGLGQTTFLLDPQGHQIPLSPGVTWVELAPSSVTGPGPSPVAAYSAS